MLAVLQFWDARIWPNEAALAARIERRNEFKQLRELATDFLTGREILRNRRVEWVLAYDWERVAQNSSGPLGTPVPNNSIGRILDRTPGQVSPFLVLSGQNRTAKLFRFADKL
jgi:hypothetical protein